MDSRYDVSIQVQNIWNTSSDGSISREVIKIKECLIDLGLVNVLTTSYQQAVENINLTSLLKQYITMALSKDKKNSFYGLQLVSDHELYCANTKDKFNIMMIIHCISKDTFEYKTLNKMRNTLRERMKRVFNKIMRSMDLIDTPEDPKAIKKREKIEKAKKELEYKLNKTTEESKRDVMNAYLELSRKRNSADDNVSSFFDDVSDCSSEKRSKLSEDEWSDDCSSNSDYCSYVSSSMNFVKPLSQIYKNDVDNETTKNKTKVVIDIDDL